MRCPYCGETEQIEKSHYSKEGEHYSCHACDEKYVIDVPHKNSFYKGPSLVFLMNQIT